MAAATMPGVRGELMAMDLMRMGEDSMELRRWIGGVAEVVWVFDWWQL